MSKVFMISPVDCRDHIWLIEKYSTRKQCRVVLVPDYERFRCVQCGKIDEYAALRTGISPAVRIRENVDIVVTSDDLPLVSTRLKSFIEQSDITGVECLPIPSHNYFVLAPRILVPTDQDCCERNGMVFDTRCPACGRYRETSGGWPLAESMKVPESPLVIFGSEVRMESRLGLRSNFYVSDKVRLLFVNEGFTGIDDFILV